MRSMVEGASKHERSLALTPLPPSFALSRCGWSPFPASRGRKNKSGPAMLLLLFPSPPVGEGAERAFASEAGEGASETSGLV